MRAREDVLTVREDMGTSGTLIWNLDYADPITELRIMIEAQNGAEHNKAAPIERCISEIAIVDGSDVLWSMPGDAALGLIVPLNGGRNMDYLSEGLSDYVQTTFAIRFGRYLYDPILALDPRAFRNPQLKVTFNEATVRAAGADGYLSDSWNASIQVTLMEDAPSPEGFLMVKDIYDFTTVGTGDVRVDMPTDYPYRVLAVRVYEANVYLQVGINNYELNCDGGKFKVFDMHSRYAADRMSSYFKELTLTGFFMCDNLVNTQIWLGNKVRGAISSQVGSYIVGASTWGSGRVRPYVYTHAGVAHAAISCMGIYSGWCLHNTLLIPFGRLDEISEWFNAPQYGNIRLLLSQGNANAEVNVCLQQYRRY